MKKNRKSSLKVLLILVLLICNNLYSQTIYIKIRAGFLLKNNEKITDSGSGSLFELKSTDLLTVSEARSVIIAKKDQKFVQIPIRKKPYTFKEISSLKSPSKSIKKAPPGVYELVLDYTITKPVPTAGVVTRGLSRENRFFSPADSLVLLSDTILLEFGNENTIIESNLIVKNIATGMVYFDEKPINNKVLINKIPSGEYSWTYSISYFDNNEKITAKYENIFIITNSANKTDFYKKLDTFKSYLNDETYFSEDLKSILIQDFYEMEKVYLKE